MSVPAFLCTLTTTFCEIEVTEKCVIKGVIIMTEYKTDEYTRIFVDMLTTLEYELVPKGDSIALKQMYDDEYWEYEDGDVVEDATDVVDLLYGEMEDEIRDSFLFSIEEGDWVDDWERHCDGEFTFENMLSYMDGNKDFKEDNEFLYSVTETLMNHLDDIDLELAVELTKSAPVEQRINGVRTEEGKNKPEVSKNGVER